MGLKDFLFGKKDYAVDFKNAFLGAEPSKCADIVLKWGKKVTNDANLDYANVILGAIIASNDKDMEMFKKTEYIFNHPDSHCENTSLKDWYRKTAELTLKMAKTKIEKG